MAPGAGPGPAGALHARHTRRPPDARRDGYRAHLAAGPETGIITDEKLTRAAGQDNSDPAVAGEFLDAEAAGDGAGATGAAGQPSRDAAGHGGHGGSPQEPLGWDRASRAGTPDLRAANAAAHH